MENNNTQLVLSTLNENIDTLAKIALINQPEGTSLDRAKRIVLKELINFEMACTLKPELANPNIDRNSILIAVKQAIADNLTLNQLEGLVYLIPGKVCTGINPKTNAKEYKEVLNYSRTAEGELSVARQSGAILDHKRPTCTFDGNGQVDTVTFEFLVPAYPKARWESVTFNKDTFAKWKQKSAAKFNGTPNANYGSWNGGIDPEFASSKAIKHGLKKRGRNSNENQRVELPEAKTETTERTIPITTAEEAKANLNIKNDTIQYVNFEEVKPKATPKLELPDTNELF
jgi:hypothetical protein